MLDNIAVELEDCVFLGMEKVTSYVPMQSLKLELLNAKGSPSHTHGSGYTLVYLKQRA